MGIFLANCLQVSSLLGKKIIPIAYLNLKAIISNSETSTIIATYALCSFLNIGSIGIQIGGVNVIVPSRQQDLAILGLRAMIAGFMACLMTACVTEMLL